MSDPYAHPHYHHFDHGWQHDTSYDAQHAADEGVGWVATALAYAGAYGGLVFAAVCLVAGLYYLADIVEEYTALSKRVLWWAVRATALAQVLLYAVDGAPLAAVGAGLLACVCYGALLGRFPEVPLVSAAAIGGGLASVVQTWLWLDHFWNSTHKTVEFGIAFLVATAWALPFALIISMASNDFALPGGHFEGETAANSGGGGRHSFLTGVIDGLRGALPDLSRQAAALGGDKGRRQA